MNVSPRLEVTESLKQFRARIQAEFVDGSAIAPEQFSQSIRIVSDTEQLPGGEVSYPLHEALNWHVTRFGHQARATLYGALLLNEDGSCWQAKLSSPLYDARKGSFRKYETPV